jgi:hypothetical protein
MGYVDQIVYSGIVGDPCNGVKHSPTLFALMSLADA